MRKITEEVIRAKNNLATDDEIKKLISNFVEDEDYQKKDIADYLDMSACAYSRLMNQNRNLGFVEVAKLCTLSNFDMNALAKGKSIISLHCEEFEDFMLTESDYRYLSGELTQTENDSICIPLLQSKDENGYFCTKDVFFTTNHSASLTYYKTSCTSDSFDEVIFSDSTTTAISVSYEFYDTETIIDIAITPDCDSIPLEVYQSLLYCYLFYPNTKINIEMLDNFEDNSMHDSITDLFNSYESNTPFLIKFISYALSNLFVSDKEVSFFPQTNEADVFLVLSKMLLSICSSNRKK